MFFNIWIKQTSQGDWHALPPDFPDCQRDDADRSRLLAMTRLAMEDAIGRILGTTGNLPTPKTLEELLQHEEFKDGEWFQMHFQRAQLIALAAHQYPTAQK